MADQWTQPVNSQNLTVQQMGAYAQQRADQAAGERKQASIDQAVALRPAGTAYDPSTGTYKDPLSGNTYIGSAVGNGALSPNPVLGGSLRFQQNPTNAVVVNSQKAQQDLVAKQAVLAQTQKDIQNQANAKAAASAATAATPASTVNAYGQTMDQANNSSQWKNGVYTPTTTAQMSADEVAKSILKQSGLSDTTGTETKVSDTGTTFQNLTPEQLASRKEAISGILNQGVTDANQILNYLNFNEKGEKIGDFTLDEVKGRMVEANMNPETKSLFDSSNDPGGMLKSISDINDQQDKLLKDTNAKIESIMNGTFPLTQTQQGLIDATKSQLVQLEKDQQQANANYVAGVSLSMERSGWNVMAPEYSLAQVHNAVSIGIDKIQKLEVNANLEIAKLQEGFETKNYQMINDSYNRMSSYLKQKSDTIQNVYKTVQDHADKVRDFNQRISDAQQTRQDKITEGIASIAKDAAKNGASKDIINAIQGSKTLVDAVRAAGDSLKDPLAEVNAQIKQADLNKTLAETAKIKNEAAISAGNENIPAVHLTENGKPSVQDQAAFLKSLSPSDALAVQNLANYKQLPTNYSVKGNERSRLTDLATQFDPNYDPSKAPLRQAYLNNWNTGTPAKTRTTLNTAVGHIGDLATAADALQAAGFKGGWFGSQTYNDVAKLIAEHSTDPRVKKFDYALTQVATEIAAAYKGGVPDVGEIAKDKADLMAGLSPSAIKDVVGLATTMLGSKMNADREEYKSQIGTPPPYILNPASVNTIKTMLDNGVKIDLTKVDPGNEWKYMSLPYFMKQNPDQIETISNLRTQGNQVLGRPMTEDEILQTLHLDNSNSPSSPISLNPVSNDTKMVAMRTDRNNNPTAMTTTLARQAGLVEGRDYVAGDPFPSGGGITAKLIGDPIEKTIQAIDNVGFYTKGGAQRWTHTAMDKNEWDKLSHEQKKATIQKMYKREGGKAMKSLFV